MARPLSEMGISVKRLQMRQQRAIDIGLSHLGISLVQWHALRHLDQNPGASLHDLAQLTFQSDQSFGTLAARLVDRGLIERVPGSGRAVRHQLTDKGLQLCRAGDEIVDRALTRSFAELTPPQLETFDKLLVQLLKSSEIGGNESAADRQI